MGIISERAMIDGYDVRFLANSGQAHTLHFRERPAAEALAEFLSHWVEPVTPKPPPSDVEARIRRFGLAWLALGPIAKAYLRNNMPVLAKLMQECADTMAEE